MKLNERAWAGQIISWIKQAINDGTTIFQDATNDEGIKVASGKTKFPDVLLFVDKVSGIVFNGWELKFPDTEADDAEMLENALEKAERLKSNSFVTWNGTEAIIWQIMNGDYTITGLKKLKVYPKEKDIITRNDLADRNNYNKYEAKLQNRLNIILHDLELLYTQGKLKKAINISSNIVEAVLDTSITAYASLFEFIVELFKRHDNQRSRHDQQDRELLQDSPERQAFNHQLTHGFDIPPGRDDARDTPQDAGHILDRERHARKHDNRQEHQHSRNNQRRGLLVGDGGDKEPQCQRQHEVEQRQPHQPREAARHRHIQHVAGQQQDRNQVETRQQEIGDHLGKDDPHGPHGRYQQHLHRPGLLFADDRDRGHDGADQNENQSHDARHEVVSTLHLRIVQQPHLGHRSRSLPVGQQYLLQITHPGGRRVGIRSVENQLHGALRGFPMRRGKHLPVEIGSEHDHHVGVSRTQRAVDFRLGDVAFEGKIFVGPDGLHRAAHRLGRMRRHDGEVDVPDFGRYGESEQQHLHDRHPQHDEHRAGIAQDMQRLFFDE